MKQKEDEKWMDKEVLLQLLRLDICGLCPLLTVHRTEGLMILEVITFYLEIILLHKSYKNSTKSSQYLLPKFTSC